MKAHAKLTALLLALTVLAISSCQSTGEAAEAAPAMAAAATADFSTAISRYWILSEIRAAEIVVLDRAAHADTFGDIFTMRFEEAMVYGMAMPNTFRGPYTLGQGQEITFGPMATTMMAAFMEPEEITEHVFLTYLYNVFGWNIAYDNFELHTTSGDGAVVVLVFVPLE